MLQCIVTLVNNLLYFSNHTDGGGDDDDKDDDSIGRSRSTMLNKTVRRHHGYHVKIAV